MIFSMAKVMLFVHLTRAEQFLTLEIARFTRGNAQLVGPAGNMMGSIE